MIFLFILIYAVDDLTDVNVTLVGNDRFRVVVKFFFDSLDVFLDMSKRRFAESQLFDDLLVTLKNLDRVPALLFFRQIMDAGFFDMRDRVLD